MALIKSPQEIIILHEGGKLLSHALRLAMDACVPGASTDEIDAVARGTIEAGGGIPSFLGYRISPSDPPFPSTLCISINEEVVHGPALPARRLKEGDLVGLDIGAWYQGLATDMAATVMVGTVAANARQLVQDTRESLVRALHVVRDGGLISEIGGAIEDYLRPKGYGIVRDLVGHGVGHAVHEDPPIPHYREPRAPRMRMRTGMVLAIEPMVTLGDWRVVLQEDGWTIRTRDRSLAAHFEVTVAVTQTGFELLTPWPDGPS